MPSKEYLKGLQKEKEEMISIILRSPFASDRLKECLRDHPSAFRMNELSTVLRKIWNRHREHGIPMPR